MLKWFLFQTKAGDRLLAVFERLTGLCVVPVDHLDSSQEKPVPATRR